MASFRHKDIVSRFQAMNRWDKQLTWSSFKEHPERRVAVIRLVEALFMDLLSHLRFGTTLEIGAFNASFSRGVRNRFPVARAVAFEANPFVAAEYGPALRALGVDYRHQAIAAEEGVLSLKIPIGFYQHREGPVNPVGSLIERAGSVAVHRVEVPAAALDDVVARDGIEGPYVLWVDVEGGQRELLAGASRTLQETLAIYIEVETAEFFVGQARMGEVLSALRAHGFIPVARDIESKGQFNVLLTRKELLAEQDALIVSYQDRILSELAEMADGASAEFRSAMAKMVLPAPMVLGGKI